MSVRKAQTDFFSPMTGNVFRDNRRRADLIMEAAKVEMIKTDDPFTQIEERKSYAPQDDPASISDAFDKEYGVLSDEEAAVILEENKKKIEEPTPVIDPDPIPNIDHLVDKLPTPEPTTESTPEKAVEKATGFSKSGRKAFMGNSKYKSPARVANRNKAKAMAKARKASTSSVGRKGHGDPGGSRAGRSGVGRGGARGGSTGGRGASSKGGTGSGKSSQGRGGARGGAKGGSAGRGASSKGGTSRGGARTNRSRSRRRCDIRCKFDVSLLTNMNLVNDDLATLAYFVKDIK